jgi:hypothetical protein
MAARREISSLTTQPGIGQLRRQLGDVRSFWHEEGPGQGRAIQQTLESYFREDPSLADVELAVQKGSPGYYIPSKDRVQLGVINPAVVGHEMGHAQNLRNTKLYGKLIRATEGIARVNNVAAIPAMLGIRALIGDRGTRNEILNILSGVSAAIAAPGLAEEMSASISAVKHAPDKMQAVKTLVPAFTTHVMASMLPTGVYQLGKHI